MRRMLFAAAVALLGFAGYALADGPVIRWNAVVGVQGSDSLSPDLHVPRVPAFTGWISVQSGSVTPNLATGRLATDVRGVSRAYSGGRSSHRPETGRCPICHEGVHRLRRTPLSGDAVPMEATDLDGTASIR